MQTAVINVEATKLVSEESARLNLQDENATLEQQIEVVEESRAALAALQTGDH